MFLGKYIKFTKSIVKRVLVILTVFYLKLARHVFGWEFVTNFLAQTPLVFLIPIILSKFGAKVGQNVVIKNVIIDNPKNGFENLKIGSNVYIGKNVFFDLPEEIVLEDDVVMQQMSSYLLMEMLVIGC
jgi:acetyltransferase-like isoleucine patch superfamily enzyme